MSSSPVENSGFPLGISIGLFLASAALLQLTRRGDASRRPDEDEQYKVEEEEFRKWYRNRRLHDRLSYDNVMDVLQKPPAPPPKPRSVSPYDRAVSDLSDDGFFYDTSDDDLDGSNDGKVGGNLESCHVNHMRAIASKKNKRNEKNAVSTKETVIRRTSDFHPNADFDFHPKNRNWSHFERFNEEDQKQTSETGRQVSSYHHMVMHHEYFVDGSEVEILDETEVASDAEEEEFVWTMNQRGLSAAQLTIHDDGSISDKSSKSRGLKAKRPAESGPAFSHISQGRSPLYTASSLTESNTYFRPDLHTLATVKEKSSSLDKAEVSAYNKESWSEHSRLSKVKTLRGRRSLSSPNLRLGLMERLLSFGADNDGGDTSTTPSLGVAEGQPSNRSVRAQYNALIMPEKVVLIRHGQSMGNINEELYSKTPDNAMPLTDLGWEQARMAGKVLKEKVFGAGETVHFIVSPYVRTVETFHGLVSAWCDPKDFSHIKGRDARVKAWYGRLMELGLTWNEDSRIREQDFGNYQDPERIKTYKRERHQFGTFYYRFPHGESASDVFDRVSIFLDSLWRSFEMNRSRNYVLVTHGIAIRVFLARYFRYTIDQFNILSNPRNCEMVVLGHNGDGRLELDGRCELIWEEDPETGKVKMKGYSVNKRLRILPQAAIRKVAIKISKDDCVDNSANGLAN